MNQYSPVRASRQCDRFIRPASRIRVRVCSSIGQSRSENWCLSTMIEPFSISAMIFEPGIFLAILMFISGFQGPNYVNRLAKLAFQSCNQSGFVFHPSCQWVIDRRFCVANPHILAFDVVPCDDREDVGDGFLSLGHVKTIRDADGVVNPS